VWPCPRAGTVTYTITDAGNFGGYIDGNTADTFSGTGFVGIYPTFSTDQGTAGPSFAHLFGLENYNGIYSETEMQVDVSALAGKTINSATLSYVLLNGGGGSQTVTATSWDSSGTLAYNQTLPSNLGSTNFTSNGLSPNSADVTSLLQARVSSGGTWFGLYLTPDGPGDNFQWTYTNGYQGDPAQVRLTVNYTVPEPASLALLGLGVAGLGGYAVRRRKAVKG
jgi:hypothetical protein